MTTKHPFASDERIAAVMSVHTAAVYKFMQVMDRGEETTKEQAEAAIEVAKSMVDLSLLLLR